MEDTLKEISKETARRYVLGRQGLWPGRRWQGLAGVGQAVRAIQTVQVDTISVVERNHDLVLWSRVADYQNEWLDHLLYTDRQLFEYGHILLIYPMEDRPYMNHIMASAHRTDRTDRIEREYPGVIEHVRERIRTEGPLGSRDFKDRAVVPGGFLVVKDVQHGLYCLWLNGELIIHSRRGSDKLYELTERFLESTPSEVEQLEAELFLVMKALRDTGLASASELARRHVSIRQMRPGPAQFKSWLQQLKSAGLVETIRVEGVKDELYYPTDEAPLLEQLSRGEIPAEWQPLGPTTEEEVLLLAPLDNVLWDRARLKNLFDFDYVWEVYKPAPQRKWGYYTLPILYGDRFVARLDPKLDRKTGLLTVLGFWLDEPELANDEKFAQALSRGLASFARYHGAKSLHLGPLAELPLADHLTKELVEFLPAL